MRFRLALALIAAAAAISDVEPAAAQYGQYAVPFALGGVIGQMQLLQQQQYMLQQQQNLARQQAGAAWSQPGHPSAQTWYYCDPARAYYPYVATCSAPWRAVNQPQTQCLPGYVAIGCPLPPPRPGMVMPGPPSAQLGAQEEPAHSEARRAKYPGPAATRTEYLAYVHALITQHYNLLPLAVVGDRRGEALIEFRVLQDGTIAMIKVRQSSGWPDIDARVEQMVAAVRRAPPLAQWFQGPSIGVVFGLPFPDALRVAPAPVALAPTPQPYTEVAQDDWCAQAKLPSSIAVCSEPELRALAVERQHVFDEARSRLSPAQQKALLADQNGWVKTYPQACGLGSDVPPSLPLAPAIKDCMAQAGRARVAYLHAYGGPESHAPAARQASADSVIPSASTETPPTLPSSGAHAAPGRARFPGSDATRDEYPLAAAQIAPAAPPIAPTASHPSASAATTSTTRQGNFISTVIEAREKYQAAPNDMAKGGVRSTRREALCRIMTGQSVSDWTGTIYKLSSNSDGKGVVELTIGPNMYIKTFNNSLSDISAHTLIEPNSAIFRTLSAMSIGDKVRFSGNFFYSDVDCLEEGSISQNGSLTQPEFIFQFSSVSPDR